VAKAFYTVWVDGLLFKLTTLNFPSYLVKIISSYIHNRTFEAAFLTTITTRRCMRAGVAQGGLLSPVLFSLYVNDMPVPSRHVELALYAGDTVIISTSRKSALPIKYLETYLSVLERWPREWNIAINVSKSNAILISKATFGIPRPRPFQFLGQAIEWVDTARYLGVTLDSHLNWSPHIVQIRKNSSQRLVVLGCLLNRRSGLSIRNGVLLYKKLIRPMMDYACLIRRCAARSYVMQLQALDSNVFSLLLVHRGTSVTGRFTRTLGCRSLKNTPEP
jgi:hypothetical protein